jgi:ribosomal protein L10
LIISNIASVCGCTVPKYTNTPILKGQTGTITVTYNAAALAPFSKGLTITSNAKTPTKIIYIKGDVVAAPAK